MVVVVLGYLGWRCRKFKFHRRKLNSNLFYWRMLAVDMAKSSSYLKQFNAKTKTSQLGSIHAIQASEIQFLLSDSKVEQVFNAETLHRLDILLKLGIILLHFCMLISKIA